jgi:hypothetical protein
MRKRQVVVSLSTTEVKYMETTHACKKTICIIKLCLEVGLSQRAITIQCDCNIVICLARNPTFHAKTKHIDTQYHFVKEMAQDGKVILEKVDILQNLANALMKSVSTYKFKWCCESMGLMGPKK